MALVRLIAVLEGIDHEQLIEVHTQRGDARCRRLVNSQTHSRLAGAIAKVVRDLRTNRLQSHPGVCRAAADDERQFKEGIAPLAGVTRRAAAVVSVVVREHEGTRVSV